VSGLFSGAKCHWGQSAIGLSHMIIIMSSTAVSSFLLLEIGGDGENPKFQPRLASDPTDSRPPRLAHRQLNWQLTTDQNERSKTEDFAMPQESIAT
jgi:hypothetical protein